MFAKRVISLLVSAIFLLACSIAPRVGKNTVALQIPDGVYEGSYTSFPNFAKVRVTVSDHRIQAVELLRHVASERAKDAEVVIPRRIVEQQSTDVDAVTGATNSSRVIMHATAKALKQDD